MFDRTPNGKSVASIRKWRRAQRWATLIYAVFLLVVSVMPGSGLPKMFDWSSVFAPDKVAHFGAYAIFAVLLSFTGRNPTPWKRAATAVLLATVFGILMEFLQWVAKTGRQFDLADMLANFIGALLGGLVFLVLRPYVSKYFAPARS